MLRIPAIKTVRSEGNRSGLPAKEINTSGRKAKTYHKIGNNL